MSTVPPELARNALDAAPDAMIIIDEAGVTRFAHLRFASKPLNAEELLTLLRELLAADT